MHIGAFLGFHVTAIEEMHYYYISIKSKTNLAFYAY